MRKGVDGTHHQEHHGVAGEASVAAGEGETHVFKSFDGHVGCGTGELLDIATRVEGVLTGAAVKQHGLAKLRREWGI